MKKIIYTSFPCLIESDEKQEHLSQNEHLIIEDEPVSIKVFPENKDISPFEIDIENPSPLYRIIKKEDKLLIFLIDGIFAENVICHNFNYDGIKSSIEISKRKVVFCGKKDKKIINMPYQAKNVKVGAFLFINYVKYDEDNGQTLIAYNPKKNTAKVFTGEQIELDKDGFTVHKTCFNYKKIEENYYVDKDGLKVRKKDFVTIESSASPIETIPYKFMTAIKLGDFNNSIKMLSTSLSQKLDENVLKKYFGEVSYFYMLDPNTCFAISNNRNVIYEFSLLNDKISDINDIN